MQATAARSTPNIAKKNDIRGDGGRVACHDPQLACNDRRHATVNINESFNNVHKPPRTKRNRK
eukprot:8176939-Lingulodinium_polyedra.AAC.1